MGILDKLKAAEGTFKEALGVAEEIVTVGDDLLGKLKGHRDDLRAASGALLGGIGGIVSAIKSEAAAEQGGGGDGSQFLGRAG